MLVPRPAECDVLNLATGSIQRMGPARKKKLSSIYKAHVSYRGRAGHTQRCAASMVIEAVLCLVG